jgi:hypothetical protein
MKQTKQDLREGRELITNILKNNEITTYKISERFGIMNICFTIEEKVK